MIRFCTLTAGRFLIAVSAAVFFAATGRAADSSLWNLENGLTELVYRLSKSVVSVEVSQLLPTSRFGGVTDETYAREHTTGIVVDSGRHLLVAARPVLGRDKIVVRTGEKAVPAELVAVDYQTELAVLRLAAPGGLAIDLSHRHLCAGQMVVAISQVLGVRSSPSLGFCAGVRDDGTIYFKIPGIGRRVGAGVFDLSGRLLGFVVGADDNEPGTILAVPAYRLPAIVSYLLTYGNRQSGYAGIRSQEIEISPGLPVPRPAVVRAASGRAMDVIERGVVVSSIVPASPAHRAGLSVGDLIYAVDDMPVNSAAGLASLVRQSPPGTRLELDLLRRNRHLSIPLVIGRKSLDLSEGTDSRPAITPPEQSVDSLRQSLELLRSQLYHLERRLDALD